jgi:glutamate-1-semialdehyde 2,1-aminomutase
MASLAGGVSSGLRRSARPYPLFFTHGSGSRAFDVDRNSYLDYGLAWGPLILGHAPAEPAAAASAQLSKGVTFGAQHDLEFEVAEQLTKIIPCADLVCFANSGTEIVQLALRLARGATGRRKFLKFEGHYHGWDDSVLVDYHPTLDDIYSANGEPIAVGRGQKPHRDVIIARWNHRESVEAAFAAAGDEISAVICEPLLCNSGCIPPEPDFLKFLREITLRYGTALIFDEVITGFRVHLQGAQGLYGVIPDLATFGKAIGGGVALSVLGGSADWMRWIADGTVVHAGTLNGNPLALTYTQATLAILERNDAAVFVEIERNGERLRRGLEEILRQAGHTVLTQGVGSVFQLSFMDIPATEYRDTLKADKRLYQDFSMALLDEGILTLPDGRWYTSAAHSESDIDATLDAVEQAVRES